ncbi:MAG: peptide-methionine (S)-S-oxide reductase MsrA, partial [Saprospiraceae bacterium]
MKKISFFSLFILVLAGSSFCSLNKTNSTGTAIDVSTNTQIDLSKFSKAYFAGGCFWCEEAVFESVIGVSEVISGYSGGHTSNPSYEEVGGEQTGHAESIEVYYDPAIVTYSNLVKVYLASIDPTQVQGQGPDHGDSYRSLIFYQNEAE